MPHPATFAEALGAPAYIVNLTRRPDRLTAALAQVRQAGYRNVVRFAAVDGRDPAALARGWAAFDNPPFSDAPPHRPFRQVGHQGCFLSHMLLWAWIARGDAPFATVFEDDIFFHPGWRWLAPEYLRRTPPDWDILHLGHHAYIDMGDVWVGRVPAQSTAAYTVTREGAANLTRALLGQGSVGVIDQMIPELQMRELAGGAPAGFGWRVWNGRLHPLPSMAGLSTPSGLVFQRVAEFGSDIVDPPAANPLAS
ncbi:MAG TPA: glycosyltransferase family 25 protein [Thermomicrobiales bacterium]|nr:glycosyltransferase family 25 protein [Thermomicrobiales bacterium]